ncbi:hypothetical protein KRR40_12505 [Niabella defluvii]|nr:hypothetical protein KRR40_12505 [Niabella sp. I65]
MGNEKPYITGYYGCTCHPFKSWTELDKAFRKKFRIGDKVRNRCSGLEGEVYKILPDRGFYVVKYGPLPRDQHLEHAQELELIGGQMRLFNPEIFKMLNNEICTGECGICDGSCEMDLPVKTMQKKNKLLSTPIIIG